jgi:hypothetical protein
MYLELDVRFTKFLKFEDYAMLEQSWEWKLPLSFIKVTTKQFFGQIINYKIKIQLEKDHMNLTNKELINEYKVNDFVI